MNKDWEEGYAAGAVDALGRVVDILHGALEEISNLEEIWNSRRLTADHHRHTIE